MWDPRRILEDRTPARQKDSPRERSGFAVSRLALEDTICRGCAKVIGRGQQMTEFHPSEGSLTEAWHTDCWSSANIDTFEAARRRSGTSTSKEKL
jgi:hypothetical protein